MTLLVSGRRGVRVARGVYAAAELYTLGGGRRMLPVLSIRLAAALDDALPARDMTLRYLRGAGWTNPAGMLRRGGLTCPGWAMVDGVLGAGPVRVAGGGLALFHGQVDRTTQWVDAVRTAGTVPVAVSAAGPGDDLLMLARAGLAVTAPGRLMHGGGDPAPPARSCEPGYGQAGASSDPHGWASSTSWSFPPRGGRPGDRTDRS